MANENENGFGFGFGDNGSVSASLESGEKTIVDRDISTEGHFEKEGRDNVSASKGDVRQGDTEGASEGDASGGKEEKDGGEASADGDLIGELHAPDTFDAGNPENVAEWDKEYLGTDGDFNLERFQKEVSKNMLAEGGKAQLNENTYAYLKAKGIGKGVVDQIIADRLNALEYNKGESAKRDGEIFSTADTVGKEFGSMLDGPDLLKEAIVWAKGTWSDAQKKRYDEIQSGSDHQGKLDAVEALIVKYARTEAFKKAEADRKANSRKRVPERDATQALGKPSGADKDAIKDIHEYRKLRAQTKNQAELAALARRAKAGGII